MISVLKETKAAKMIILVACLLVLVSCGKKEEESVVEVPEPTIETVADTEVTEIEEDVQEPYDIPFLFISSYDRVFLSYFSNRGSYAGSYKNYNEGEHCNVHEYNIEDWYNTNYIKLTHRYRYYEVIDDMPDLESLVDGYENIGSDSGVYYGYEPSDTLQLCVAYRKNEESICIEEYVLQVEEKYDLFENHVMQLVENIKNEPESVNNIENNDENAEKVYIRTYPISISTEGYNFCVNRIEDKSFLYIDSTLNYYGALNNVSESESVTSQNRWAGKINDVNVYLNSEYIIFSESIDVIGTANITNLVNGNTSLLGINELQYDEENDFYYGLSETEGTFCVVKISTDKNCVIFYKLRALGLDINSLARDLYTLVINMEI